MTLFPLSISKSFSGYHLVSLFFFPPGRKTLELAFSSHPLLLNVFYVELVALAKLPLIYVSHVMQWHATPCIGREGAGSGMEEQGCSWRRRAIAVGGGRFAMLTIVIYLLSSLFLGSLKKARSITQLVLAGFVLICIQRVYLNLPCLILYTILWLRAMSVYLYEERPHLLTHLPYSLSETHRRVRRPSPLHPLGGLTPRHMMLERGVHPKWTKNISLENETVDMRKDADRFWW